MKRIIFCLWVYLFCFQHLYAQDQTNFTQFYFNPYLINPSYAGIDGKTAINVTYRKQWATLESGPQLANLSLHTPVSKRVSTGFSVTSDKRGLLNNSGLLVTFGYSIPFDDESFLRFGLSGGAAWNTVDIEKLGMLNDPALGNLLDNNTSLLGNTGISVHIKTFHVGFSLPVIFTPSYVSNDAFSITEVKPFQSFIFHVSNRFYFNRNKNIFEPYALYRMSANLPPQLEVAGILHLNHVLWVGGSFKQDFGISALGGIKLNNTLAIGGSYSLKNSGVNELNSPTYEISLGLLLGERRKNTPMYSFVNTEKERRRKGTGKSASERIAAQRRQNEIARKKQQDALAQKKQQQEEAQKKQAELARKQEQEALAKKQAEEAAQKQREELARKQREEAAKAKAEALAAQQKKEEAPKVPQAKAKTEEFKSSIRKDTVVVTHRPRFNAITPSLEVLNIEVTEHTADDERERIARLEANADNPKALHNESNHPNSERHEFVQRGNHKEELDVADYVVTGVFKDEANARQFTNGLKKLGFKPNYGYLTEKAVWYVYLHQSNDINKARTERDRYRKMIIFRDAWLLTVHH